MGILVRAMNKNRKEAVLSTNENKSLNFLKGCACLLVVCMHSEFPGRLGIIVQTVGRFAVPLFFMISGYFCYYEGAACHPKIINKIKRLLIIIGCSLLLFFFINRFQVEINGDILRQWLLFNQPPLNGSLWFLFALLYDLLLFYIINRLKLVRMAYFLIPVLLVSYIALAQVGYVMGFKIENYYYKNWFIEGFPLFMLGHFIHQKEDVLKRIKSSYLLIITVLLTAGNILERYLLKRDFGMNIATIPQVGVIFILALQYPHKKVIPFIYHIGVKYSLFIYIVHRATMLFVDTLYNRMNLDSLAARYLYPITVIVITVIAGIIFYQWIDILQKKSKCY